ncbi:MAG: AAA family ATPase [Candidatus Diapherotrites archaeon]|nr:AAA family ATPase [Candidatus Diapherotrites archaeon]
MNIIITGTPGVGKTTLAKLLAKKLKMKVFNEKNFALKNRIGSFNEDNELEIPIKVFEKKANLFLKKNDRIIFEGHTLCEMKLKVDKIVLITIHPEILELRLESRNYKVEKIMDNVFCEGIDYCKKKVFKNYPRNKVIEIGSRQHVKETFSDVLKSLGNVNAWGQFGFRRKKAKEMV